MAVAARRVRLFYDVLSPYSWIGFEVSPKKDLPVWKEWRVELKIFLILSGWLLFKRSPSQYEIN